MFNIEKNLVKAGRLVNTEHVDTVIKNYKQERWVHNSKRIGKEDSLSVWYSVDELEEFLQKAREHGGDGIRMYFGAYGQRNAPMPLYEGRQTIVLVATKQKQVLKGEVTKDVYINTENGSSILAYNAGKLCPPFCSSDDFGEVGITIVDKGAEGLVVT